MTQKIIAGVDIGGTKTRIMAYLGERMIADEVLVTESWRIRQMETDATTLAGIVANLCGGVAPAALAVGAHGCDTGEQCLRFQALLADRTGGAVQVVNDAELMVPAAGHVDGIGVVSGTGSIAVGKEADLLLVDGDPETNIGDLRHVDQVVLDGALLDGDALRKEAGFSGKPK